MKAIVLIFSLVLFVAALLFNPFYDSFVVHGASMNPGYTNGEVICGNKVYYNIRVPLAGIISSYPERISRGDVIIFKSPTSGEHNLKRVVATPGDTVMFHDNHLYINNEMVNDTSLTRFNKKEMTPPRSWHLPYLTGEVRMHRYNASSSHWGPIWTPEDSYFVLGDNIAKSSDSRTYGFIKTKHIVAKPFSCF